MDIILWVQNHLKDIIAIITGIVTVASIIAKLTLTETDDKKIGKILQFIYVLALNNKPTTIK